MAYTRKGRRQSRMMRLLTLICFFHFSGLNNGITMMVVSSGGAERVDFAPVAIGKVAGVLNPAVWKQCLSEGLCGRIFSKPGRVIGSASQRAVQQMLSESALFQMWVKDSLQNFTDTPSEEQAYQTQEKRVQSADSLAQAVPEILLQAAAGSCVSSRKEAWVSGKLDFCRYEKDRNSRDAQSLEQSGRVRLSALAPPEGSGISVGWADPERASNLQLILGETGRKIGEGPQSVSGGRNV